MSTVAKTAPAKSNKVAAKTTTVKTSEVAAKTAPVTTPNAFGIPENATKVGSYSSPKFSTVVPNLRGNITFFAYALSKGVDETVLPFCNPNRKGKGACLPYTSERFGILDKFVTEDKRVLYRISNEEVRNSLLEKAKSLLGEGGDVVLEDRILRDYRECKSTAGEKKSRVGVDY